MISLSLSLWNMLSSSEDDRYRCPPAFRSYMYLYTYTLYIHAMSFLGNCHKRTLAAQTRIVTSVRFGGIGGVVLPAVQKHERKMALPAGVYDDFTLFFEVPQRLVRSLETAKSLHPSP